MSLKKYSLVVASVLMGLAGSVHADQPGTLDPAVTKATERGVAALIKRQHVDDGSWGGDDVKVQSSHKSDYPVAISSLGYLALMSVAPDAPHSIESRSKALRFVLDTIENGKMKNTRDNTPKVHERNLWSQGFGLLVFGHILRSEKITEEVATEIRAKSDAMIRALAKTQQPDGGWTYDKGSSESFTTATILLGLLSARDSGIAVPDALILKPMVLIAQQSNPGHYVAYQGIPGKRDVKGKVRDSIGRSVQVELALLAGGSGSREKLKAAVQTFFQYRERLDKVRDLEKGCHQPPYRIGTFYCFYNYFYLAQALEVLGGDFRDKHYPVLRDHFLALQKPDGYWIDSRDHCGESYGTAMAMLILSASEWARPSAPGDSSGSKSATGQ